MASNLVISSMQSAVLFRHTESYILLNDLATLPRLTGFVSQCLRLVNLK